MFKKVSALIEVRKLIALSITAMFIVLSLRGQIDNKLIEYVIVAVITYYFAKSTALDQPGGNLKTEAVNLNE